MGRLSLSAAANMLVDEGLRMHEHPGVLFRTGPTGRRAGLAMGPDIWEIVRAVKGARAAEPELGEHDLLSLVAENTGVPVRVIRLAIGSEARPSARPGLRRRGRHRAERTAEHERGAAQGPGNLRGPCNGGGAGGTVGA